MKKIMNQLKNVIINTLRFLILAFIGIVVGWNFATAIQNLAYIPLLFLTVFGATVILNSFNEAVDATDRLWKTYN